MALANAAPLIVELAAKITSSVAELQVGLAAQGLENPSWAENSPPYLPSNLHQLRDEVLDATAELHEVLLEPLMLIYKFAGVMIFQAPLGIRKLMLSRSRMSSALTQLSGSRFWT
jgi:hypothetical protein